MCLFDAVSIGEARAKISTAAGDAADAAAGRYALTHSLVDADAAADLAAQADGATLAAGGVTAVQLGHVVTLTVTVSIVPGTALIGHLPGTGSLTKTVATTTRQVKT
jgi:Flp pilus assembly protein TadG